MANLEKLNPRDWINLRWFTFAHLQLLMGKLLLHGVSLGNPMEKHKNSIIGFHALIRSNLSKCFGYYQKEDARPDKMISHLCSLELAIYLIPFIVSEIFHQIRLRSEIGTICFIFFSLQSVGALRNAGQTPFRKKRNIWKYHRRVFLGWFCLLQKVASPSKTAP